MSKLLEYGNDGRQKILNGVEKLAKTVAVTMGPMGKNVIVGKHIGAPSITKDGVSVAREVVLEDPIEELGCQLVKEAAGRTAAVAGDGTTTATVLTHSILKGGVDLMKSNYNPLYLRDGMNWAKQVLVEELAKLAHPLDTDESLNHISTISVNSDIKLGKVISDAFIKVNREGLITAEAMPGVEHSVRLIDGVELNSGYISNLFLEENKSTVEMNNPLILICNFNIATYADTELGNIITQIAQLRKEVLLLCLDLKKEAFDFTLQNFISGRLNLCPIKIPKLGKNQQSWLEDFADLVGAVIIGGDTGLPLSEFNISHLGSAKRVSINSYRTKIIEPSSHKNVITEKVKLYKESVDHLIGDLDRKDLQDRIGFLTSKTAVITVGYSTELELREKGDRVEDAIFAVKAAIEEGYVVGGGFALWRAAQAIEDSRLGEVPESWHPAARVLLEACKAPARQIIANAGLDPEIILKELDSDPDTGYNTAIGKFGNLVEMGVIDPKKVTRTALENATSIALLLITTDAIIAENPRNESSWQPPAGYRLPDATGLNHKH